MSDHVESAAAEDGTYPSLWKNRDFVRLLSGRLITNAGDSLYAVAAVWLVHDLTQSTMYTGLAEALLLFPLALQFIFGPLVDRWPLIRTLVVIQLVQAVAIISIPVATYTGNLTVELLLVTIPLLALLNQFVYPAQNAALPRIIADKQLTRGNSAFSFVNRGVDMLFEALGGILIALIGAASLFILDSITFILAALLFVGVKVPETEDSAEDADEIDVSGYIDDLKEGAKSLRGTVFVEMIFTTAVLNFGVGMMLAVLPQFSDIRGGPTLFGVMLGALGVGTALGAALASRLEHVKYGHLKIISFVGGCILWLGAVYATWPPLIVCLFGLAWIPAGISNVMSTTLLQTATPDDLLGRVFSVNSSAATLTLPIGALIGGVAGTTIGTVRTMTIAGLALAFVGVYFALRPPLRRLPAMNNIDPAAFNVGVESTEPEHSD